MDRFRLRDILGKVEGRAELCVCFKNRQGDASYEANEAGLVIQFSSAGWPTGSISNIIERGMCYMGRNTLEDMGR